MKRCVVILSIFLSFAAPKVVMSKAVSPAQSSASTEPFSMPQAQVVRWGLGKFMEVYSQRTRNYSTQGQMQGYDFYTRCKQADNNQRAVVLSSKHRHLIALIRRELEELGNASWSMTETESGGGTMWRLAASSAYASREDALSKLIVALKNPRSSRAARHQTRLWFAKTQDDLKLFRRAEIESNGMQTQAEAQRAFDVCWKLAKVATTKLQRLAARLPDNAAQVVAQRGFDEIDNAQQDEEGK